MVFNQVKCHIFVKKKIRLPKKTTFFYKKSYFFLQKKVLFLTKKSYFFLQKKVLFFGKKKCFSSYWAMKRGSVELHEAMLIN